VALIALLGFLVRNTVVERLKRSISHEYDQKLESIRRDNERVLESLRAARAEREAFRTLAFSSITSVQSGTLERRVVAIETLWNELLDILRRLPPSIIIMDMMSYDKSKFGPTLHSELKRIDFNQVMQQNISGFERVLKIRPFLGERLFSLFHAAQAVAGRALTTTVSSYQSGNLRLWYDESDTVELLQTVLSEQDLVTFKALRAYKFDWLRRHFELSVIQEIQKELSGEPAVEKSLLHASRILEASDAVMAGGQQPA